MNYTEKEIEIIKQKSYDKGRLHGVVVTLLSIIFGFMLSMILP
jgi:hypothetical protein